MKDYLDTPDGILEITASDTGLRSVCYVTEKETPEPNEYTIACMEQLSRYFKGEQITFDIPFDWSGTSEFYQSVWKVLLQIPYGKTTTYSAIATQLGKSKGASQAIGKAVGSNPIGIVVPCHRVIGKDGDLRGFAWGLERKEALLKLEGVRFYKQGTLF